jgi:hypothetical protein
MVNVQGTSTSNGVTLIPTTLGTLVPSLFDEVFPYFFL